MKNRGQWGPAGQRWNGIARAAIVLALCAALVGWDVTHRAVQIQPAQAVWPVALGQKVAPLRLHSQGYIPMPPNTPAAHSSTLLAMPAGDADGLLAFWFAGTKESMPDVGIAMSGFDLATQHWGSARFVVNRQQLSAQLGFAVRRIGNPVAWLDADGKVHIFVVATGLGGWAASRIAHLRQSSAGTAADGLTFEPVRVLPLSWWWNTSYLVRTAPLPLNDGGMVLPVHFELGIKYPVALCFGPQGDFLGMVRMSQRTHLLQPALLMQSSRQWLALMRDQRKEGRVAAALTTDGGEHWQDMPDLSLTNPDSSVAGRGLAPGYMVLAHNTSPHARNLLDLSASHDGLHWTQVQQLAQGQAAEEFSYPAMAWAQNSLWVSYTDQRKHIAWQRFSVKAAP